jgi:hypothetical protein
MASNSSPLKRRLAAGPPKWALLSKHGMVVVSLAMTPSLTSRQLAAQMGLTERTLFTIIRDLVDADLLRIKKVGRVNTYIVNEGAPIPNPRFAHLHLRDFLAALRLRDLRASLVDEPTA